MSWCLLTSDVRVKVLPHVSHVRDFCLSFAEGKAIQLTVLEGLSRWSIFKELDEGKSLIDVNIWSVPLGDGVKVAPCGSAAMRFVYSSVRTS